MPVVRCVRWLRVLPPLQRGSQNVLRDDWNCFPPPDETREFIDEWGNRVLELRHARIEREFRFDLRLETARQNCEADIDEGVPSTGLGAFLLPSSLCDAGATVRAAVEELSLERGTAQHDAAQAALQICTWTHRALRYEMDLSLSAFPISASQALERRTGMCQEFAHVMIALCRSAGLAARYVSGYIPAEGLMHAWVEVLCGGVWLAFDPTHDRPAQPDCVFVASGRDWRDVKPLEGTYFGRAQARLQVWCRTEIGAA